MRNAYFQILLFGTLIFASTYTVLVFSTLILPPIAWFALLFFTLLTMALHAILSPVLKSDKKSFIPVFMGTQGIRMFFSLGFLILYLLFSDVKHIPFLFYFLLLYLFFTGFEIYLLLSNLRTDFTKGSNNP